MKNWLALSLVLVSSTAFADATLRIPLFIEGPTPAAEVNKLLRKAGAKTLPIYIEVSSSERKVYEKFKALDAQIEKALNTLGGDYKGAMRQSELIPGDNNKDGLETCYTGNAREVPGIVTMLPDLAYSDQLNMWGWKYKNIKEFTADNSVEEDLDQFLSEESKLWKEWRGRGEAILILTAVGDGGDDVNTSLIKRCE